MSADKMPIKKEKIAPVQGYTPGIPWSLHLEAYDAYRKKYGAQEALIDLEGRGCRGGFGVVELDTFIPGWRDKVSEIGRLKASSAVQAAEIARLTDRVRMYEVCMNTSGVDGLYSEIARLTQELAAIKNPADAKSAEGGTVLGGSIAQPALLCGRCGSDRAKEKCKAEHWQVCGFVSVAHQEAKK